MELPDCWHQEQRDAAPNYKYLRDWFGVARKAHRCVNCGNIIKAGENYERTVYICDDQFYSDASHPYTCWLYKQDS